MTYFKILEKYNGDLNKATKKELDFAERDNPNTSLDALSLAKQKYEENLRDEN